MFVLIECSIFTFRPFIYLVALLSLSLLSRGRQSVLSVTDSPFSVPITSESSTITVTLTKSVLINTRVPIWLHGDGLDDRKVQANITGQFLMT